MINCILCNYEFVRSSTSTFYPPKLPELCCRYFHSSLTQEILLSRQSNQDDNMPFCPKCFESLMELNNLNDQLEFNQKMISEFIFIRSLEILHRRGQVPGGRRAQNGQNDAITGRQLIEFDVSALPNCEFRKINSEVLEEATTEDCHNVRSSDDVGDNEFQDALLIASSTDVNVNTADLTFESVKVESTGLGYIDESRENETERKDADLIIRNTIQNSEFTGGTVTKILSPIPILKGQKPNFPSSGRKAILMENKKHTMAENDVVFRPIWIETGLGSTLIKNVSSKKDISTLTKASAAKSTAMKKASAAKSTAKKKASAATSTVTKASAATSTVTKASAATSNVTKASAATSTVTKASAVNTSHHLETYFTLNQATNEASHCRVTNKAYRMEQQFPEMHLAIHLKESLESKNSERLRKHMKTKGRQLNRQQMEKLFKCDVCSREFRKNHQLLLHKRVHEKECPFRCDICGSGYFRQGDLIIHKSTHLVSETRSYECEACGKKYFSSNSLKKHHKIVHTDQMHYYKCQICEKVVSSLSYLKIHTKIHTGEKPYECEFCGKRFSVKCNLTVHRRIHTGERPYKCDVCDMQFLEKGSMLRHQRSRRKCYVTQ